MGKGIYFLVAGLSLFAFLLIGPSITGNTVSGDELADVQLYKSASCGCCGSHSSYLEGKGFSVNVNKFESVEWFKDEKNIPAELRSCHTSIFGDYFVEGHMPIEAINKLLEEKPDIAGIALPGMPAGSPGMPGIKNKEWIIYSINHDGSSGEFMRI